MSNTQTDSFSNTRGCIEDAARIAHEVNRAYCASQGDNSQPPWEEAPEWQKDSARKGVEFHLQHFDSKPEDSHNNWMAQKLAEGWTYGPVKDVQKKQHPCIVPFTALPVVQQTKDWLFIAVVRSVLH